MTFKNLLMLFIAFSMSSMMAQTNDTVLFSIDSNPIYKSEFLRVYNKNLHILADESQKDISNYLDLFVNYKLKVQQAKDLGLDTAAVYQKELATYKKQLMEPYLKDETVTEKLIQEAYDRSLYEVNASHILVRFNPNTPNDTITAYKKITEARAKIVDGESFETIAIQYSEDPSVKRNNGALGFFTVFNMVYPFENAAFTTEVGLVSQPFKTRFGYHILKVNEKRKAKGEVEAAHIMIKGDSLSSETKIREIYAQLQQGEDFKFLAKTQSEDKFSAQKEGSLGKFGSGKMVKEFEDVAFSLEEGKMSEPFKTQYGWHILTVTKKYPIQDFVNSKDKLGQEVKRSDRSTIISSSIVPKLKKKYTIKVNNEVVDAVRNNIASDSSAPVLTIENKQVTVNELKDYLNKRPFNDALFNSFQDQQILTYYKNELEQEGTEFSAIFKEYKEGLLLFELLQAKVWDKAKDSVGIENFYVQNKSKYKQPKTFDGVVAICTNKKSAKTVKRAFDKGIDLEDLKKKVNKNDVVNVIFKSATFGKNDAIIPESYKIEKGVSDVYEEESRYVIISSSQVIEGKQQELDEVRGAVINDYQTSLEDQWVDELHASYEVNMNDKVIKEVLKN